MIKKIMCPVVFLVISLQGMELSRDKKRIECFDQLVTAMKEERSRQNQYMKLNELPTRQGPCLNGDPGQNKNVTQGSGQQKNKGS